MLFNKQDWRLTTMTLPTGSHNYAALAFRANLEKNPEAFRPITDGDIAKIEQQQAARRAVEEKAKPTEPLRVELNRLRNQLFTLQQNAHATEVRVNNEAGTVRLLEQRITEAIKSKKQCEEAGNLLGGRSYEHQIQSLEEELADTRERLLKNQRYNAGAARELRTWQSENGPRLLELKKEVD